jgi:hypothetical protein
MAIGFKSPSTLEEAAKTIKTVFVASMLFTGIVGTLSVLGIGGFGIVNLACAIVLFALSFGVYRKSRVCAVLLLVYLLASHLFMWFALKQIQALAGLIIFPFFIRGIQGTFAHHKLSEYELKPLRIIEDEDTQNFTSTIVMRFGGTAAKPPSVMAAYHIFVHGEQKGPMSKADVQQFIQNGLPADTLYWCEGMAQWKSISEFS